MPGAAPSPSESRSVSERPSGRPPDNVWSFLSAFSFSFFERFLTKRIQYVALIIGMILCKDDLSAIIKDLISGLWHLELAVTSLGAFVVVLVSQRLTTHDAKRRIKELADQKARFEERLLGASRISSGRERNGERGPGLEAEE